MELIQDVTIAKAAILIVMGGCGTLIVKIVFDWLKGKRVNGRNNGFMSQRCLECKINAKEISSTLQKIETKLDNVINLHIKKQED